MSVYARLRAVYSKRERLGLGSLNAVDAHAAHRHADALRSRRLHLPRELDRKLALLRVVLDRLLVLAARPAHDNDVAVRPRRALERDRGRAVARLDEPGPARGGRDRVRRGDAQAVDLERGGADVGDDGRLARVKLVVGRVLPAGDVCARPVQSVNDEVKRGREGERGRGSAR